MTIETELPEPDYLELTRQAAAMLKFQRDKDGIYVFYAGHRVYLHPLTIGEVMRHNLGEMTGVILQND